MYDRYSVFQLLKLTVAERVIVRQYKQITETYNKFKSKIHIPIEIAMFMRLKKPTRNNMYSIRGLRDMLDYFGVQYTEFSELYLQGLLFHCAIVSDFGYFYQSLHIFTNNYVSCAVIL